MASLHEMFYCIQQIMKKHFGMVAPDVEIDDGKGVVIFLRCNCIASSPGSTHSLPYGNFRRVEPGDEASNSIQCKYAMMNSTIGAWGRWMLKYRLKLASKQILTIYFVSEIAAVSFSLLLCNTMCFVFHNLRSFLQAQF